MRWNKSQSKKYTPENKIHCVQEENSIRTLCKSKEWKCVDWSEKHPGHMGRIYWRVVQRQLDMTWHSFTFCIFCSCGLSVEYVSYLIWLIWPENGFKTMRSVTRFLCLVLLQRIVKESRSSHDKDIWRQRRLNKAALRRLHCAVTDDCRCCCGCAVFLLRDVPGGPKSDTPFNYINIKPCKLQNISYIILFEQF